MGALIEKPEGIDSVEGGELHCEHCTYTSNDAEHLRKHSEMFHVASHYVMYYECDGSIDGRNAIFDQLPETTNYDMTGGQAALWFKTPISFDEFVILLGKASNKTGIRVCRALHMYDPGLGLEFAEWWVDAGIKAGVFKQHIFPDCPDR